MKRASSPWTRHDLDPAKAGAVVREAGFSLDDADPVSARAHRDGQGRLRRIVAQYPTGWRATVTVHTDGTTSLCYDIRIRATVAGKAA